MPHVKKLTPNLIVASVERSLEFYTSVLGFERGLTVPDQPPLVFASVVSGPVEIFFNDTAAVLKEHPEAAGRPIVAMGNSMFIEVEGIGALHDRIGERAKIVMPLKDQWYGMREFSIEDLDGYLITFAERIESGG